MTDALRIKLNPKYLAWLVPFIAKQDIRYYLNGLCVERAKQGGVYLVGCDGHTMAVVYDKDGSIEGADDAIFRVSPGLIAAAKKANSKHEKPHQHRICVLGERVFIAPDFPLFGSDRELYVQPGRALIEGKYPDWRRALPDFATLTRGAGIGSDGVNASYLARLDRICKNDDHSKSHITLWTPEGGRKIVAQVAGAPELLVVIMPTRGNPTEMQRGLFAPFPQKPAAPDLPPPGKQPSDAEPVTA